MMKEFLTGFGIILLFVAMAFGLLTGCIATIQYNYCQSMTNLHTTFQFHYDFWAGCLVQSPSGYWLDATKYQYLEGDIR